MAASRGRLAAVLATAALTAALAGGCGAAHQAMDCVHTADTIADGVTDLQQAVENAAHDPGRADAALDAIERNVRKIGDKTDDTDVDKAVDDLDKAVGRVRTALRNGDRTPDVGPVTDAAGELTKGCAK
ncbi:hypothetical protein GTY81_04470 [Streptomyces sp. SID8366]|uniref:hypothetical protein n=1 Tax=unclassified Streptomyces TaxID=2593676 RepID=UPI000DBA228E|nr:hypothetical protein [Streptomyces sp. PsTaAH-130]MYU03164.1 hypothetical protein [Streptomyces sp. SID8366]MYU64542.1 hypothetical protein [Streptomyces sp. SID69]RAJ57072.1 hypothetical protein K376_03957 [Streptomyces sp. PsTaAH-130]